jgi:branched-subunit amino acid aminotransferase/4-amino-4-deoxychorismate lyase
MSLDTDPKELANDADLRLVRAPAACRILGGITRATLLRITASGELAFYAYGAHGHKRYAISDLLAYRLAHRTAANTGQAEKA